MLGESIFAAQLPTLGVMISSKYGTDRHCHDSAQYAVCDLLLSYSFCGSRLQIILLCQCHRPNLSKLSIVFGGRYVLYCSLDDAPPVLLYACQLGRLIHIHDVS